MTTSICTLNLNGIRSAERRGFTRWLAERRPDHLCLQELRASVADVEEHVRTPLGYGTHWLSAEKKGYAGTALYTRGNVVRHTLGTPFAHCANEGRAVRADFEDLSVISLYVPSGSSSPERQAAKFAFLDCLGPWMEELLAEGRPIALCGDFNIAHEAIDLARPKQNQKNSGFLPEERAWFSRMLELGWVDVLRAQHPGETELYSWWSNRGAAREKNIGWRLDYVLATPELAVRARRSWIEAQAGLSDHAPVWVEFE